LCRPAHNVAKILTAVGKEAAHPTGLRNTIKEEDVSEENPRRENLKRENLRREYLRREYLRRERLELDVEEDNSK